MQRMRSRPPIGHGNVTSAHAQSPWLEEIAVVSPKGCACLFVCLFARSYWQSTIKVPGVPLTEPCSAKRLSW